MTFAVPIHEAKVNFGHPPPNRPVSAGVPEGTLRMKDEYREKSAMLDETGSFGLNLTAPCTCKIDFRSRSSLARVEPPLEDVLADPLIHRLMERDGVQMTALQHLIRETKNRLR
jgi:hypothetical protein